MDDKVPARLPDARSDVVAADTGGAGRQPIGSLDIAVGTCRKHPHSGGIARSCRCGFLQQADIDEVSVAPRIRRKPFGHISLQSAEWRLDPRAGAWCLGRPSRPTEYVGSLLDVRAGRRSRDPHLLSQNANLLLGPVNPRPIDERRKPGRHDEGKHENGEQCP